ncbi:Acyl-coenzyme A thioesterase 13 [Blattella germanica]|nr:Acyl-coenzyme A thioesterase 13 [Blattella germanica]
MSSNGFKIAKEAFKLMIESKCFDRVMSKVRILSGGEGRLCAELTVEEEHQNRMGTLHGGLTATLVDTLYLSAARNGETVVIDCNTLKAGKTLAFLEVEIKSKTTGKLIAKGSHTKFIGS